MTRNEQTALVILAVVGVAAFALTRPTARRTGNGWVTLPGASPTQPDPLSTLPPFPRDLSPTYTPPYQPPSLPGRHPPAPDDGGFFGTLKRWGEAAVEFVFPGAEAATMTKPPATQPDYKSPAQWRAELQPRFRAVENNFGMPVGLLEAVAEKESAFRHDIITCQKLGGVGEKGLMQIYPKYHPDVDGCDPIASIDYAGTYLRELYNRFGTWEEAIAAYNWGPTNLATKGLNNAPSITKNYIAFVRDRVEFV